MTPKQREIQRKKRVIEYAEQSGSDNRLRCPQHSWILAETALRAYSTEASLSK